MTGDNICAHRWEASRIDVTDSVPVQHFCGQDRGHQMDHRCACGAVTKL